EAGIRLRPVLDDARDFLVLEVVGAKGAHLVSARRPMMPSVRNASASPAMRPPPMSDVVSMSCGWPRSLADLPSPTTHPQTEEKIPPTPYQSAVGNSTKPP